MLKLSKCILVATKSMFFELRTYYLNATKAISLQQPNLIYSFFEKQTIYIEMLYRKLFLMLFHDFYAFMTAWIFRKHKMATLLGLHPVNWFTHYICEDTVKCQNRLLWNWYLNNDTPILHRYFLNNFDCDL